MDAKTAVELLRQEPQIGLVALRQWGEHVEASEIADYIDQQAKRIEELEAKNIEFANITDEYVANGYKLADAVEQVEIENRDLKQERDELSKKVKQLESQVAQRTGQLKHIAKSSPFKACELAEYFLAVTPMEVNREVQELEKYAELGRLALTTRAMVCSNNDFIKRGASQCKKHCTNYLYCKLRSELLAEEVNWDA